MLVMMLLYTFITYLWQKKKELAYYAMYIVSILCFLDITDHRFLFQFFTSFPNHNINFYNFSVGTVEVICINLYGWFAIQFMDLRKNDKMAYQMIVGIVILSFISVVIHAFHLFTDVLNYDFYKIYRSINRYALSALSLAAIVRIIRLRGQIVTFFILGTLFYVCGMTIAVIIIQTGNDTRHPDLLFTFPSLPTQLGMILEAVCFTIGFSVLNRRTELEKFRYQQQLVEQLLENETKQQKLQLIRDDIARDLHDEIGSDLSALSIMSDVGMKQVGASPDDARATFKTIGKVTRQVLSTMREIVWSLNSSQDSVESMSLRMKETALAMFQYTAVQTHIEIPEFNQIATIEPHHRRDFLLIFKEILHNVIKHADATRVNIKLTIDENVVMLKVADDGKGFHFKEGGFSGNGLKNLRQRSDKLTGNLTIESVPGKGTTVTVNCPIYRLEFLDEIKERLEKQDSVNFV